MNSGRLFAEIEYGWLIVQSRKPKCTLGELLAGYDPELDRTDEDEE